VWPVFLRRITPAETIANDLDDLSKQHAGRQHMGRRGSVGSGTQWLQLRTGKPEKVAHGIRLINGEIHY